MGSIIFSGRVARMRAIYKPLKSEGKKSVASVASTTHSRAIVFHLQMRVVDMGWMTAFR